MKSGKLHSSWPYFFLVALLGLIPVLNNKYPAQYFPGLSPWWIEVFSTFAGISAATIGFMRLWARSRKKARAGNLVLEAVGSRHPAENPSENDVDGAGRLVSRLVRNVDEDLREIVPDFPRIRSGAWADSCRSCWRKSSGRKTPSSAWEWRGFTWGRPPAGMTNGSGASTPIRPCASSAIYPPASKKREKLLDPFLWAADLMAGKGRMSEFIKEIESL